MIILTCATNYDKEAVLPFYRSLMDSGFSGKIVLVGDDSGASVFLKGEGAEILPDPLNGFHIMSRRFLAWKEFLRGVEETVVIADIRDVVFQSNPEDHMPAEGVNVFEEWEGQTIGTCPYNSKWMFTIFGNPVRWEKERIICAGITSGQLTEYCTAMWEALTVVTPHIAGLDQAIHNHLIYSGRVKAKIHTNEEGPVYTVGYIPRETVRINEEGVILNYAGDAPCMIHQYDRHENLKQGVRWL